MLSLAILALLLQATPPATKPKPAESLAVISGRVLNSVTQEPVRKAQVAIGPAGMRQRMRDRTAVVTDDEGRFRFEQLEPGKYRLWANKSGFVAQEYGGRAGGGTDLTVAAGQSLAGIDFQLVPAAVVRGRVLDEDGEPLEGAQVALMAYRYVDGRRILTMVGGESTNDVGEFRIGDVRPGARHYALASHSGSVQTAGGERVAYGRVFYPNAGSPEEATALVLRPGEQYDIDFQLVPQRAYRISGRILGLNKDVHRGAQVMVTPADSPARGFGMFRGAMRDQIEPENPVFELDAVPPGKHVVRVFAVPRDFENQRPRFETASAEVTVGEADVRDLVLALGGSGVTISGRVVGAPAGTELDRLNVFLRPLEEEPFFGGGRMMMGRFGGPQVKADGTFTLEDVREGEYSVEIFTDPRVSQDVYVKAVRYGGRDAFAEPLKIAGEKAEPLEIVLGSDAGTVVGVVRDSEGRPLPGAVVTLIPPEKLRQRHSLFKSGRTDQNGRFEIRGAMPGEYRVLAWNHREAAEAVRDAAFLKEYESAGKLVQVLAGGSAGVELQAIPYPEEEIAEP